MNIALVIKSLSLTGGGAERFSLNLIRGLLARGHNISAFCFDWDSGSEQLGISLHKIPKLSPWKHPWFDFSEKVHNEINKTYINNSFVNESYINNNHINENSKNLRDEKIFFNNVKEIFKISSENIQEINKNK
jgi:hypothetical protein